MSRKLAIASLCVHGTPARTTKDNVERLALLSELMRVLQSHPKWHSLDAIVLPGGFFRLSRALGASDFRRRKEMIEKEAITASIKNLLDQLDMLSPGVLLATGVLANPRDPTERTEQTCLAFTRSNLHGAARKIFPTRQESRGRRFVSPFVDDFKKGRIVALPRGHIALLNACYDVFGIADLASDTSTRRHAIRRILIKRGKLTIGDEGFRKQRDTCLKDIKSLVTSARPEALLVGIHGFFQSGRCGYWQRHGISRSSAASGGALVVGAAHFQKGLPAPQASTLAAYNVPFSQISAGASRRANQLAPVHAETIETPTGLRGLLRVFRVSPGKKKASPR
jgi:hypothetical protein